MIKPIELPGCRIPGNLFLAPMAGYTDAPFRSVCIEQGASFTFTEMVSSEACFRKNDKTLNLLKWAPNEKQLAYQIFTGDPRTAAESIKVISKSNPTLIDLNCGCSVPKILKSGSGAALLQSPGKIKEIVKAMKSETDIPVSIKIRSGWDCHSINYLEIAEKALEAGIAMITLHPRTRSQLFTGHSNWEHLKILKQQITSIPVIGSGDLFTPEDIRKMLADTGCDGVMVARGVIGNPFLFSHTIEYLNNGNHSNIKEDSGQLKWKSSASLVLTTALKQLKMMSELKGEERASVEMRKHFCAYSKGLDHSASLRKEIVHCTTYEEYDTLISQFLESLPPAE